MLLKALCFTVPWAIDSIRVHLELRRYDADGNMVLSLGTAGGCNESTGIGDGNCYFVDSTHSNNWRQVSRPPAHSRASSLARAPVFALGLIALRLIAADASLGRPQMVKQQQGPAPRCRFW